MIREDYKMAQMHSTDDFYAAYFLKKIIYCIENQ